MTFGHGVFDSFAGETDVFNWELFGYEFCTDDKVKDIIEEINPDGDKFAIKEYKACKDRSDPERAEDEHYYRVYHYKPCEEGADGCSEGWEKQEDWTVGNADSHGPTSGFDPNDADAAREKLDFAIGFGVDKGMVISGCMDENASNYNEMATHTDDSCECNEGYEKAEDGTCQEVTADDSTSDDSSDSSSTSLGDGGPAPTTTQDNSKVLLLGVVAIGAVLLMGGKK